MPLKTTTKNQISQYVSYPPGIFGGGHRPICIYTYICIYVITMRAQKRPSPKGEPLDLSLSLLYRRSKREQEERRDHHRRERLSASHGDQHTQQHIRRQHHQRRLGERMNDTQTSIPRGKPQGTRCVQRLDDSRSCRS